MSYRLINSNEIAIKYPEVNDMPCIYADIPNGLNGDFYDLSVYPKDVLDKIRDEIIEESLKKTTMERTVGMLEAVRIIDNYTK